MQNKPMGMLLQDPSLPELRQDYQFPLDTDLLAGTGSSKLTVRDADLADMPLYQGLDWASADLSFDALNQKGNFIDNPQFHQVNAFAVAAHTLDQVEAAIGREMKWKHGGPLVIRPHAFADANAFYDPSAPSLNFGSFSSPFRRAPVWTCLSHDIVAHEFGHAVLDSFRPLYVHSEEVDTGALHESIGDLMAMFSALKHKPVVERLFAESGGDMMNPSLASGLAEEFGIGLWGVSFPFLRSALNGPNYDEAPWEIHDRSTVWTAAIYEILAGLVAKTLSPSVKEALEAAPTAKTAPIKRDMMQQTIQQARSPAFEAYYAQADVRSNFDTFFDAIVAASGRVTGMMLRALQDIPPTGVTLLTLARVLYNADARLFPDDPEPRELAKEVFQRRKLWVEEIDLNPPGIGASFEEPAHGSNAALMRAVHEHADALRIPLSEGARILNPRISTVTRTINAGKEQRGIGTKTVTERCLYYTYELLQDACIITPEGEIVMGKAAIYKGGTLVMDENWNDLQLATDPDLLPVPEEGEGTGEPGEPVGVRAIRRAKQRFIKTHRQSLRAFRDGLVRPDGTLPNGQPALPFRVTRQSSGAGILVRNRCNLKDHLLGVAGKHAHFPFELD
ncbi:hypothetical protein VSS37_02420 [Candidatus Thiothrix sp. Deng01]|uniref:Peptidase M4 domain-containing protein n=1 Tax=Candidatus Thiothrix phosphatis TaxID=3112415 RepID=A0ABU6CUR8_9GAMM|nr:hypothetical protein [Candidatus Thiothrix sp. Deng01]MEB4589822.1 hypothetical protein [Candidatus Thiothrix sp. Deng01]